MKCIKHIGGLEGTSVAPHLLAYYITSGVLRNNVAMQVNAALPTTTSTSPLPLLVPLRLLRQHAARGALGMAKCGAHLALCRPYPA